MSVLTGNVLAALLALAAVGSLWALQPWMPHYVAVAQIEVAATFAVGASPADSSTRSFLAREFFETQKAVLRSHGLCLRGVESARLARRSDDPGHVGRADAIDPCAGLSVRRIGDAFVLEIRFVGESEQYARDYTSAIIAAYLDRLRLDYDGEASEIGALHTELLTQESSLLELERARVELQARYDVSSFSSRQKSLEAEEAEYRRALTELRIRKVQVGAKLAAAASGNQAAAPAADDMGMAARHSRLQELEVLSERRRWTLGSDGGQPSGEPRLSGEATALSEGHGALGTAASADHPMPSIDDPSAGEGSVTTESVDGGSEGLAVAAVVTGGGSGSSPTSPMVQDRSADAPALATLRGLRMQRSAAISEAVSVLRAQAREIDAQERDLQRRLYAVHRDSMASLHLGVELSSLERRLSAHETTRAATAARLAKSALARGRGWGPARVLSSPYVESERQMAVLRWLYPFLLLIGAGAVLLGPSRRPPAYGGRGRPGSPMDGKST
jgi:hypothetical protein